jgi:hypothetical protein
MYTFRFAIEESFIMALYPNSSSIKKSVFTGFAILFFLSVLVILIPGAYLWLPAKVRYHIVEKHTVSVSDGQARVNIGIIVPKSGPYQTVSSPIIQWSGEQEWISYAYIDTGKLWGEIEGAQPQQAVLEYDVILRQGKAAWESPAEKQFTLPGEGIESDHPSFTTKALELDNDPYKIYQFTSQHVVFSEEDCIHTDTSALDAYRLATGACCAYSRLMVALCRAAGTPARMIIGAILPDNYFPIPHRDAAGIPGAGHAWVEYYSQGKWYLADPSWGKGYLSLMEFNRSDGRHLSYGERNNFYEVRDRLFHWASGQSFIAEEGLTYIIASSKDTVSVSSEIGITKKWDGRWVNTLAVTVIVTFSLCKIRDKLYPSEKSSNPKT